MGVLDSVIKLFVGDKSQQDVKKIQPLVDQVKEEENKLEALSLDDLRHKTVEGKAKSKEGIAAIEKQIEELKAKAEESDDITEKEDLYTEIDDLEDQSYEQTKVILDALLPEAFAVVKETAKRFAHNETLEVTATEYDRVFSADRDYITLEGDKAIWVNHWDAAGKEVVWDMIHYDVQLIGGVVMHQGKIA